MSEIGYLSTININQAMVYMATEADIISTSIPVTTGINQVWKPLLRLRFDNISVSELYNIYSSIEGTNDTGHSVSLVSKIILNSNYDDQPGQNGAIELPAGGGGANVSPEMHHQLLLRGALWVPSQYYGQRNITLMVRAVSSVAVPGDIITFTSAPCVLSVARFRND